MIDQNLKSKLSYGLLFAIIAFGNILQQFIPELRYFDEIVAICCFVYVCITIKRFERDFYIIVAIMAILTAIGLIGNARSQYQDSLIGICKDILAFWKMPITFIAVYMWSQERDLSNAQAVAVTISKVSIVVIFIACVVNIFQDIGMSHYYGKTYDIRYGFRCFKFLYSHPTFLVYGLVLLSVVLVADQGKNEKFRYEYLLLYAMDLVCMLFTFRDKGFAYIALFCVILLLPKESGIKKRHLLIAGAIAFVVSYPKLLEYRSWPWSPRYMLYFEGFRFAAGIFPFGSGFATWNSSIAGEYGPQAYRLAKEGRKLALSDIGDAQIPYYYVQFGFVGFALFAIVLYLIFRAVKKRYGTRPGLFKASLLLIGYMLIGSLVEAVFTNESGVTSILVLLLYMNGPDKWMGRDSEYLSQGKRSEKEEH